MHPNSFPPRQSSRNPEISELRLILKTFVPFQFNFTHWVNHNQSFPALADTSKGRKDWADTNSSNAAFRLNQAEWDIKALAITQIWKAERWIISNSLQYSCLGPDRHSHSKCLMFWLQSASHTDLTAVFFNFGPFTHVFMHNPLPWTLKCWNSACKQIVHAGSKYICEYLATLAPKKGPKNAPRTTSKSVGRPRSECYNQVWPLQKLANIISKPLGPWVFYLLLQTDSTCFTSRAVGSALRANIACTTCWA